jgi:hypothetical protein
MKTLSQLLVASVVIFALTTPVFAGQMDTMVAPPPPPLAVVAEGQMDTTVAGQIETPSGEATAADSATEIALNLLQSVLVLF